MRRMDRMRKSAVSLLLVLALVGCGGGKAPTPPRDESAESRTFVDDRGREVVLEGEISRIVPSAPLSQIILFAIAPDLLVGLAGQLSDDARGIIDDEYFQLPVFGSLSSSADLNVEELALAGPQLIVDIGERKDSAGSELDKLQQQTGIPSVFISATLETMPETYRTLGRLLGREARGEELAQFCERVYDRTVSIMEQVGEDRVRSLYVLGEEGLNVIAAGSYHGELMDLLTENVAVVDNPISKGSGNQVTMEQIALWDPDFVIFAPDSIYDRVEEMSVWEELGAVRAGRYVRVPEAPWNWMGTPPSVQRYLGLIWLTDQLYPDHCDYDVQEEIVAYYDLFYGCALTQEQYLTIMEGALRKG